MTTPTTAAASDGFMRFRPEIPISIMKSRLSRPQNQSEAVISSGTTKVVEFPVFVSSAVSTQARYEVNPAIGADQLIRGQDQTIPEGTRDREHSMERIPASARQMVLSSQNPTYPKQLRPASVTISRDRYSGQPTFELQIQAGSINYTSTVTPQRNFQQLTPVSSQPIIRGIPGGVQSFKTQAIIGQGLSNPHTSSAALLPERPQLQLSTPKMFEKRFF